jgi:hypothetical protein
MIGRVTGEKISTNIDGDVSRVILQVEIIKDEDTRSIELFTQAGEDTNPGLGCRVNIVPVSESYQIAIGVSDDLTPEVAAGEKEFYSTDSPVTEKRGRFKLESDGTITMDAFGGAGIVANPGGDLEFNGGAKSAVSYLALNTALQLLVTAINGLFATKLDGGGTAGTAVLDISAAESDTVLIP